MYISIPELLFKSETKMYPGILSKENLTDPAFTWYYEKHMITTPL